MSAWTCPFCSQDLAYLPSAAGRRIHVGKCEREFGLERKRRLLAQANDSDSDSRGSGSTLSFVQDGEAAFLDNVSSDDEEDVDGFPRQPKVRPLQHGAFVAPRTCRRRPLRTVPARHPFRTDADFLLAALWARRPELSAGLLQDFLDVLALGKVSFRTCKSLYAGLDALGDGLQFNSTTIQLQVDPTKPSDTFVPYTMQWRSLRALIARTLHRHGDVLQQPDEVTDVSKSLVSVRAAFGDTSLCML